MTSREAVLLLIELLKGYHHQIVNEDIKILTIKGYPLDKIIKELEDFKRIKQLYNDWKTNFISDLDFIIELREILNDK